MGPKLAALLLQTVMLVYFILGVGLLAVILHSH
jgi:hypothetical protein